MEKNYLFWFYLAQAPLKFCLGTEKQASKHFLKNQISVTSVWSHENGHQRETMKKSDWFQNDPAHFLGVFSRQSPEAKELSKYGYASVQATIHLAQQWVSMTFEKQLNIETVKNIAWFSWNMLQKLQSELIVSQIVIKEYLASKK